MAKRLVFLIVISIIAYSLVIGSAIKRHDTVSETTVGPDTIVTNVSDTLTTTIVVDAETTLRDYRMYNKYIVKVYADSFVAVSVADTTHLNDSIGATAYLYAQENNYSVLLDSETMTLPGGVVLEYGGWPDSLYTGLFLDSLRIDVINIDSILTTNDSATFDFQYEVDKIELKSFFGDDNR